MTNKRRLKKEIDYLVSDLIYDCFTFLGLYESADNSEAMQVVQNTLIVRNELRDKANHPEKREAGVSVKSHYDAIARQLVSTLDEGYSKLGKLVKKA